MTVKWSQDKTSAYRKLKHMLCDHKNQDKVLHALSIQSALWAECCWWLPWSIRFPFGALFRKQNTSLTVLRRSIEVASIERRQCYKYKDWRENCTTSEKASHQLRIIMESLMLSRRGAAAVGERAARRWVPESSRQFRQHLKKAAWRELNQERCGVQSGDWRAWGPY